MANKKTKASEREKKERHFDGMFRLILMKSTKKIREGFKTRQRKRFTKYFHQVVVTQKRKHLSMHVVLI